MSRSIRLNPEESVLVVVDVQERLAKAMARADQVVKAITVLIRFARQRSMPILATQQYTKGLGPTVAPLAGELAGVEPVEKMAFSCCGEPVFLERLAATGRSTIILTGMETHVCVLQTALDLLDKGFAVRVPWDAVCSRNDGNRDRGLDMMARAGALVTTTESEVFFGLKAAGTSEFKEISSLLK